MELIQSDHEEFSTTHLYNISPSGLRLVHAIYLCLPLSCSFATRTISRYMLEGLKRRLLISKSRGTLDPTHFTASPRVNISTSTKTAEIFYGEC